MESDRGSLSHLELEQGRESCQSAALLEELILEQLRSGRTALHIHTQAHAQKALQLPTQQLRLLQRRRAVRRDEVQRFEGLFVEIRGLVLNHLDRHDTEGPDIDFRAIFFLLHDFGGHPVWRAHHRCAF